nr:MAG TPA: hypothetical protein [Caudoviricetes sp.]
MFLFSFHLQNRFTNFGEIDRNRNRSLFLVHHPFYKTLCVISGECGSRKNGQSHYGLLFIPLLGAGLIHGIPQRGKCASMPR